MANRRQVEFEVLLEGVERGERKLDDLGDAFDELRRKVERLDGKTARVKGIVKIEKDSDRLRGMLGKLGGKLGDAGKEVAKFASYAGLAAGAAGPLALVVGAAAVATAQFVAAVAPAAAALLPLAAGAAFVQLTFKGMGEEFLKSVEPMTAAWTKQTAAAGRLATQGIRPLAREFVRVNFPAIAAAQERIARSTNRVVTGFGKWVNSAPGVKVISQLTGDAARSFEALAPSIRGVAQSLLMLAGRISGVSFDTFTSLTKEALDKLNGFIDRLGADDVNRAFYKIRVAAHQGAEGIRALVGAIQWLDENRKKILQVSDAILALTAVGAALIGGWIVALGASLLLLARHWDDVTAAVQKVQGVFSGLGSKFTSLQGVVDSFGVAWASVKTGFREFVADVGPRLQPTLDRLGDAFIKLQPAIAATVTILGALAKAFLEIAGPVVGGIITGIGLMSDAFASIVLDATSAAGKMLTAFAAIFQPIASLAKKLKLPFADAFQSFVDGSRNAANRINASMAQVKTDLARREMDRLQAKVNSLKGKTVKTEADKRAIAESQARINSLIRTIYNIPTSRSIYVTTYFDQVNRASRNSSFGNPATGGGRAAGGPVMKGQPYIVGEHRRELFIPREAGRIENKVPTGWNSGGGSTTVMNFSFPNYVGSRTELLREMRAAVKRAGGGNVQKALGRAS
jgi:hypothetical protein